MTTDYLDALGVACLILFGFAVWPPLALLVFGAAVLLASYARGEQ